jgi:RND family efflux transporter MFP subunit
MRRLLRFVLPIVIVGAGAGVAAMFVAAAPQAAPVEQDVPATFVEVQTVELTTHRTTVRGMGLVTAEKQVAVQPEVGGRVVEQNTALVAGGRLAQGDPLIRIDSRDYSSALKTIQADLAAAKLQVREETSLREVAEHEWRDRPEGFSEETLSYALRQPHLDAAKARVQSAQSRIDRAKRDLNRTLVRAPFDSVVLSESVDVGQTVGPQVPFATLAGLERFLVEVSLPVSELRFIDIPEVNTDAPQGSAATVLNESAESTQAREGYVVRLQSAVDQRGRLAQLFIAVDDPLGVHVPVHERPLPLLLGSYARVEIRGRELENVVVLPRSALRGDGTVWILDAENRLEARPIEIVRREPGLVIVGRGLQPGDRVVTTPLAGATAGVRVTIAPDVDKPAPQSDARDG